MPKKKGKDSRPARGRYNSERRWQKNKIKGLDKQIKKLENILKRNPESKVQNTINELLAAKKVWLQKT